MFSPFNFAVSKGACRPAFLGRHQLLGGRVLARLHCRFLLFVRQLSVHVDRKSSFLFDLATCFRFRLAKLMRLQRQAQSCFIQSRRQRRSKVHSPIGKSSEFFGRLKSYSISFKSAVAEKLSATSNTSENSHELCDLGFVDSSEHTRDNAFVTEIQPSGNSLMSNMMTKALQAAASVASDYRGSSVSSTSSLPSGAPPSAESLTSTLSCAANELRELVASSASSSITTHYYQNVTKLVRGRLAGIIPVYLHIHLLYARIHFA